MKNKSLFILIVLILSKNLLAATEPFTSTPSQVGGSNMDQNQPMLELYIGDFRSAGVIDGFGKTARFAYPEGITVDKNGNVFVSE